MIRDALNPTASPPSAPRVTRSSLCALWPAFSSLANRHRNSYPAQRSSALSASLRCLLLFLLAAAAATPPVAAQATPLQTIEQEVPAVAWAPDGRLAYAVRRIIQGRRIEQRRDDIFILSGAEKPKRIVDGGRLVRGGLPFSYAVQSMRWSPDGQRLTVELLAAVIPGKSYEEMGVNFERGIVEEFSMTLLLDDTGKEIKIQGADSVIPRALNATWLGDGVTVAFVTEAQKPPNLTFSMGTVRPAGGRGGGIFDNNHFTSVAWDAKRNLAIAIERDPALRAKPRLVALDIVRESRRELTELDAYLGQLSVSPSGTKVAYFRDYDTMEIRDTADPQKIARVKVAYGVYAWSPDETSILMKRALERRKGDLYWIRVPALAPAPASGAIPSAEPNAQPILHGLGFRDFALAPDGKRIAVTEPGKRNLLIYSLE